VRFRSFKDLDLRGRMPFVSVLAVPLVFVLVFLDPPQVLFVVFLVYAVSGPVGWVLRRTQRADARAHEKRHRA